MLPDFSVVIPTCQQPALLLTCLEALAQQRLPRDQYEIIVVDDANSPETATAVALLTKQIARSGGPLEIRYLGQPQPKGPAAARNRGWRAARGHVIAFTDDDCLPDSNWLLSALTGFQRGAQVMTGQLCLRFTTNTTPTNARTAYLDMSEFISANCFCRKSAIERVGGFEEAFDLAWHEDNDLQFKFIQAGIPISKCPQAIVVHPMRETPWYTPLTNERKNRYDALLFKRHPELFRQRIATDRSLMLEQYAAVLGVMFGVAGTLSGSAITSTVGFGMWGIVSANHIWHRLSEEANTASLIQTVTTTLATPFVAVYWRLYGAVKYRVLYW
ncbi:glycosyltransferase family 2 protein [Spirosoma agri]|uniref:Glycosyltransferase n=1 Tax=Spirosoma agri TaxID=1987381 RepID=A0A6M0IDS4_9BACT|nr:glycosyltransferase [Spirosoma agri]NEU65967.1 glycosyltransferase [Spirosoma agri]